MPTNASVPAPAGPVPVPGDDPAAGDSETVTPPENEE